MALAAAMKWTVKTGGSSANSGGFKVGASGTDYSKQDSAQFSVTDLAIDAVTNTKVTSATIGFDATSPGNTIIVSAGAGFTTGTYEILSVAAGVATLDRAVGTVGSTGGTAKLGGAKARLDNCDGVMVAGNTVYIEGGTYSSTTTNTLTADGTLAGGNISIIGYPSGGSQTDQAITEANMPVLTSATNSIVIISLNNANFLRFRNLKITHTAATRGIGITGVTAATSNGPTIDNCIFDGCSWAVDAGGGGGSTALSAALVTNSTVRNSTAGGLRFAGNSPNPVVLNTYISACAGPGISLGSTTTGIMATIAGCVISGQTGASGHGIQVIITTATTTAVSLAITGNVLYNNAQNGIRFDYTTGRVSDHVVSNNILVNNAAYGISCATAGMLDGTQAVVRCNAFYNNTSGARQNFATGEGDVTLSGVPFTNAGSADFSLDNTASEGAACRSVAWPSSVGAVGATAGTNYQDIGPLQAQASAGGGTVAYGFAG